MKDVLTKFYRFLFLKRKRVLRKIYILSVGSLKEESVNQRTIEKKRVFNAIPTSIVKTHFCSQDHRIFRKHLNIWIRGTLSMTEFALLHVHKIASIEIIYYQDSKLRELKYIIPISSYIHVEKLKIKKKCIHT